MIRLQNYKGVSKLKQAALKMLVSMVDHKTIQTLTEEFNKIDKDRTGMIDLDELQQAIAKNQHIKMSEQEILRLIQEVDYFGTNKINWSEFLMATLDIREYLDENKLRAIFNQFDTDGSGVLTRDNIIATMDKIGNKITHNDLELIMNMHDLEGNGVISFEEFRQIFKDYVDQDELDADF